MSHARWTVLLAALLLSCGSPVDDELEAPSDVVDDGKGDGPESACGAPCDGPPPAAPLDEDPGAVIGDYDRWLLIGNELTPAQTELRIDLQAPPGVEEVVAWIGEAPFLLERDDLEETDRRHHLALDVSELGPGDYEVLFAEAGADTAFARRTFTRSHPLYVVVSIDWDGPNPPDANLERQERLHANHPELLLTHLVGPYTFTASLPGERVEAITDWLLGMREAHGDEIGLHIHPYCHFVESAGVTCRLDPTFYEVEEERAGYTVFLYSYLEDEMRQLLRHSRELFEEHGLGAPTSFRAGAWAAQIHTLRALDAEGFLVESSAVNWPLLEEWENRGPLFPWLEANWGPIDALSQPYYPATDNALASGTENLRLLEIPDNGALVDYVRADEMIGVVDANLDDATLESPRIVSIGYHVDNFSEAYFERMDPTLTHIDGLLDASNQGPVVYVRMSDLAAIAW